MFSHVVVVDALSIAVDLVIENLSRLLVDELVEEHSNEGGTEGDDRVQVD